MPPNSNVVSRGADPRHVEPDVQRTPGDDEPPPQRCGRCQQLFDGDPTLHPPARPDWWLCPPCRITLFGRDPHSDDVGRRRPVGATR